VDAVYHIALPELIAATADVCRRNPRLSAQQKWMDEMIGQGRLLDFEELAPTLAV
jgi:hypothetical protein